MQETESIDEYILQHIDPESDYLKALYRDTHVKLLRPRMASGADVEDVCEDDSASADTGDRDV